MKPASKTVEYTLEASEFNWEVSPGKTITAWGFNNQVPGPVLKASQGDTLVVKVKNNLPEPTIIHWHGVRLPSAMDGNDDVQKPIQPGETFEYRFKLPDAGTFWYHSHHNETVQVERGMYGGIIVEDENDPIVVDNDRLLLIDDMKLNARNEFKTHGRVGRWIERHDGREGSTNLINGKESPMMLMHAGQTERWRIINAASARYFLLSLGGRPFRIIATDGGLLEEARTETELLITPGERFDILVGPFEEWEFFNIEGLPYNRTTFLKAKKQEYATMHVMEKRPSKAFIPEKLSSIEWLAPQHAEATRDVTMSVDINLKHGFSCQR